MSVNEYTVSQTQEIADRTRRIETRIHQLCAHFGVKPNVCPRNALDNQHPEDVLYQSYRRIRDIETSLHQLREYMGMTPYEEQKKVTVSPEGWVHVSGHDVTLAAIRGALLSASLYEPHVPFYINIDGKEVADIIFAEKA